MVRLRKRVPARKVAEAARSHSQVFHLAAKRCNEFERLPSGRLRFLFVPTLVCYAFSIEIGLKALALYEKGKAPRNEHDLRKLFTFLPAALQERIIRDTPGRTRQELFLLRVHSDALAILGDDRAVRL